jgi:hypothetical protein
MKPDYYLNMCLEQAELSPLGQRHGCVVVKGGKIIGKGFNDYRLGYDGGALKNGRMSTKTFPLERQKSGEIMKKSGFKTFERTTGLLAGNVLSMHSEMMAINSALASSSTLAPTKVLNIKPSFAPSRESKRKRQLRQDILNTYVRTVCLDAAGQQVQQCAGTAPGAGWRFEAYPQRDSVPSPDIKAGSEAA